MHSEALRVSPGKKSCERAIMKVNMLWRNYHISHLIIARKVIFGIQRLCTGCNDMCMYICEKLQIVVYIHRSMRNVADIPYKHWWKSVNLATRFVSSRDRVSCNIVGKDPPSQRCQQLAFRFPVHVVLVRAISGRRNRKMAYLLRKRKTTETSTTDSLPVLVKRVKKEEPHAVSRRRVRKKGSLQGLSMMPMDIIYEVGPFVNCN